MLPSPRTLSASGVPVAASELRVRDSSNISCTAEQAGVKSVTEEGGHTSSGARLYEKDETYAKIQVGHDPDNC
jgi:hypothetical protein